MLSIMHANKMREKSITHSRAEFELQLSSYIAS